MSFLCHFPVVSCVLETFSPEHRGRGAGVSGLWAQPGSPSGGAGRSALASVLWTSAGQVSLRQEWLLGVNCKDRERQTSRFRRGRPERVFDRQGYGALLRRPWGLGSGEGAQEAPQLREMSTIPDQEDVSLWLSG